MSNGLIIFLYSIVCYGWTIMQTYGSGPFKIFEHIRNISSRISEHFGTMFRCQMCFPANLGIVLSLVDWFLIPQIAFTPFNIFLIGTNLWWLAMLFDCCFTSGIVWIIHHIELFFENIAEGTINGQEYGNNNEDEETIEINNG